MRAYAAGAAVVLAALVLAVFRPGLGTPRRTNGRSEAAPARVAPPGIDPPQLSPGGEAALKRGLAQMQEGRPGAGVQAFRRAVELDPRSPLPRDYLGIAYLRQRQFGAALEQFHAEIRLAPDPATGWARVADVHHAQGRDREAIQALERARALRPDLAQLHFNVAMLYLNGAELGKAVAALERCVSLEPENHYAHYLHGNLLYRLARLDEADRAIAEAIRLSPRTGQYHYGLAQVCLRRGTPTMVERARGELTQALTLGVPEPAAAHYHLALCYQSQRNWAEARRQLETSVQLAPDAWSAWYALQEVLSRLGRVEEARRARARFQMLRQREDAHMRRSFFLQEAQRNPDSADARYQLAEFLAGNGEAREARRALDVARRLAGRKRTPPELRRRIALLAARLQASR